MNNVEKIIWMSANSYPQIGGIQTYNIAMVSELAKDNQVIFITDKNLSLPDIKNITIINIEGLGGYRNKIKNDQVRFKLKSLIEQIKPILVHFGDAGMAIYSDLIPKKILLIATIHGNDFTSPWQLNHCSNIVERIISGLNRCNSVIAVSNHTKKLANYYKIKVPIHVIYHSYDFSKWRVKFNIDKDVIKDRYNIPKDRPIILTVGRLAKRKGHLIVLKALSKFKKPFYWIIVGQGEMSRIIKLNLLLKRMKSKVSMMGWVNESKLRMLYNICDIFVLTPIEIRHKNHIDSEGFGLVFNEAASCGKPIITSRISGCQEAVINNSTGILVEAGNVEEVFTAISRLLEDTSLSKKLGVQAYRRVLKNNKKNSSVKQIKKIYKELL